MLTDSQDAATRAAASRLTDPSTPRLAPKQLHWRIREGEPLLPDSYIGIPSNDGKRDGLSCCGSVSARICSCLQFIRMLSRGSWPHVLHLGSSTRPPPHPLSHLQRTLILSSSRVLALRANPDVSFCEVGGVVTRSQAGLQRLTRDPSAKRLSQFNPLSPLFPPPSLLSALLTTRYRVFVFVRKTLEGASCLLLPGFPASDLVPRDDSEREDVLLFLTSDSKTREERRERERKTLLLPDHTRLSGQLFACTPSLSLSPSLSRSCILPSISCLIRHPFLATSSLRSNVANANPLLLSTPSLHP